MSKNRNQKEFTVAMPKYEHQRMMEELEGLNHQLEEMKETVMNTSVRAHILEAEIATLFDPEVIEDLNRANEAFSNCAETMKGANTKN